MMIDMIYDKQRRSAGVDQLVTRQRTSILISLFHLIFTHIAAIRTKLLHFDVMGSGHEIREEFGVRQIYFFSSLGLDCYDFRHASQRFEYLVFSFVIFFHLFLLSQT